MCALDSDICPICKTRGVKDMGSPGMSYQIDCDVCGIYIISTSLYATLIDDNHNYYLLSAAIRNNTRLFMEEVLTHYNYKNYLDDKNNKQTLEKFDLLLKYVDRIQDYFGEYKHLKIKKDYPVAYCIDEKEFRYLLIKSIEIGYLEPQTDGEFEDLSNERDDKITIRISTKGINRLHELSLKNIESNQCFVAMSFQDDYKTVYEQGIESVFKDENEPELKQLKSILICNEEFNGKIDDEIIATIKRSKFVIADFTYNNNNVYYEAGFADGMGIPLIVLCEEKYFKKSKKTEDTKSPNKIKFDIEHHNFIIYSKNDNYVGLKKQLTNRIKRTIL